MILLWGDDAAKPFNHYQFVLHQILDEKKDALSLAAHWMYEWMHVAGYRHLSSTPDRNDVVYKVGYLFREHGVNMVREKGTPEELLSDLGQGYLDAIAKVTENNKITVA